MANLPMSVERHRSVGPSVSLPPPAPAAVSATADLATLDDLAAMTADELHQVYAACATPTIAEVSGDLRGRMLAFNGLGRGLLARALRAFARWRFFPWRGKSFKTLGPDRGEGINRVFGDRKPRHWFRFETAIAPSRAGGFDAFHLDYDNPGNPFYIRAIKDEIRRVRPGLYLGQAYLLRKGPSEGPFDPPRTGTAGQSPSAPTRSTRERARLVLYFGLAIPASET